jgi:hypothetical protein
MRKAAGLITDAVRLRAKKSGQLDTSATANVVVLILTAKSWIESGYVRHETKFKITGSVSPNAACSLQARGMSGLLKICRDALY